MNIFVYDPDPYLSSLWIDDRRHNKMLLETAQLLSTCVRYRKPQWSRDKDKLMKIAYVNHPCNLWVRSSWANFRWLLEYMEHLSSSWGSDHGANRVLEPCRQAAEEFGPFDELTPFANCARNVSLGLDFTHLPVHEAYQQYHIARWSREQPTWKKGVKPPWLN
jgi:hypothetical protein